MWFVYILRCADDSLYVGETNNLELRIAKHNAASASVFTAGRRPVMLMYWEQHPSRVEALERERQLKRWRRARKEALIAGELSLLKQL
jgi:predicted GIY-YIG superfamily endonuclease